MTFKPDSFSLTRRRFLSWSMAASLMALRGIMPLPALAAEVKTASSAPVPIRKPRPPRLLMIDPGHGGRDPGAIGRTGTQEKDITLDIARRMAAALSGQPGITAKLTRDADEFLPLQERVKLGREARADLFLSIHADSAPNPAARGLSVYTLSEKASDDFARLLADHENEADLMGGMDLPPADKEVTAILFDLTARHTRNTAQHAKASFVQSMGRNWRLLERPMRAANFAVLRSPDVPSMLVETGFLSNPQDEKILRQPQQRDKIARLMARDLATIMDSSLFG
ncbi:MAG: N-acetylmuramoyl-L-alanine amidase [Alphaproteobacteria bacterium]|nr:N-acetylmuramoyl-L-alanine amidase [Alphaproteobacteria bacterium]